MGSWKHTAGDFYGNEDDKGIKTIGDARFFGLSAKLDKPFVSGDKPLVMQYTVKHEQDLKCGGAYLKLLPGGDKFDSAAFGGDSPYAIMFGPDLCGSANKKTHVILHDFEKDENLLVKETIGMENDDLTHLYTLVIHPSNAFEVFIDGKLVKSGDLAKNFDFSDEPETIQDPEIKKPEDWVDDAKIVDPEDKKPDDWDEDSMEEIPQPDAVKPDDWDDEDDGEWEAPMIENPNYKGEWTPKLIDNPEYKGKWEHPMIPNPKYKINPNMYKVCRDGCTHVGFEIWQVEAGTIFDDIIVTDNVEEAQKYAQTTYFAKKEGEKTMYDANMQKQREEAASEDDFDSGDYYGGMPDLDGMMGDEL